MEIPSRDSDRPHVLFVGHEASRTGAPIGFLRLIRWLIDSGGYRASVWLRRGGPLLEEHQAACESVVVGSDLSGLMEMGTKFHLAYVNTATLGMQAEALKAVGLPVICHVHEMDFELALTSKANRERLRRSVERFIACSEATREALIRSLGLPGNAVTVVQECVDIDRVLRSATEPVPFPVKAFGQKLVAGMGVVSWRKGVDLFVRVCADLVAHDPAWRGIWIGDLESGPDGDRVRHELRVLGMTERIRFTGSLPEPHAVLAQADVFCLTSREDPYPLAMVEAAALGRPIVGFAGTGGVEEFCRAAGGTIVGYADTAAMASAVRALERGEVQPGRGLAAARALCHPDVVGNQIEGLIREAALTEPVAWTPEIADEIASSGGENVLVSVTAEFGDREQKIDWEVSVVGTAEVRFAFSEPLSGPLRITMQAGPANLVLQDVEIGWRSVTGMEATVIPEVATSGRALPLRKGSAPMWIVLEGRGRLVLDAGSVPPLSGLSVRWRSSPDVKGVVRSVLKASPGSIWQGIFDLLPAAKRAALPADKTLRTSRQRQSYGEGSLWS
jgi:glycosyltransferase involved in cell wall biosynthesis